MDHLDAFNVSSRKLRKPLMERKRRARINRSLDELYDFLTRTDFAAKGAKLEKADILEMTVQYLKQVKGSDCSKEEKENLENVLLERYLSGFEKCAEEIGNLLDPQMRTKMDGHLKNCLEKVKTQQRMLSGENSWKNSCSVVIQERNDLKILPSKLPNGDVLLLLSSSNTKCEDELKVWRPWW